ncbi:MAG: alkane 1-monooxygenase [Betaproteobacteria bacterium]|nr:alkane 1-monooxygenase [Betaproteobacteria bacterium]
MSKYIKGWLLPVSVTLSIWAFMQGGWWLTAPFIVTVILFTVGDWVLPPDLSEPLKGQRFLLNLPLYTILPLLFIMNFTLIWLIGAGDFLGYGAWVGEHFGIDLRAARAATSHGGMWFGSALSAAIMNAYGGTVAGHELTHRTARPFDLFMGRWMLALTADTTFAIEHVYGHHVRVATSDDPATALRGESFYGFTVRSTLQGYAHAYQLERERMVKLGKSIWNPLVSPLMRGMLENILLFLAAYVIAGWAGVGLWLAVVFVGKQFLELTNYFEHYGLVREPGKPVQPRHSWNSNHWMSSNVLYSLARHSHHHAEADAPYWTLNAYPNAPMLPGGYITMVLIALYPPLFKRLMAPALIAWDRKHATPGELRLAAEANRRSGMPELMAANS